MTYFFELFFVLVGVALLGAFAADLGRGRGLAISFAVAVGVVLTFVATAEPPASPAQVVIDCGWATLLAALIYGPIYVVVNRKSLVASFIAGLVGAVALVPLAFVAALMFSDL